jgi:hypothetical protein
MIIIAVASGLSRPDSTSSKRVSYAPRDMLANSADRSGPFVRRYVHQQRRSHAHRE